MDAHRSDSQPDGVSGEALDVVGIDPLKSHVGKSDFVATSNAFVHESKLAQAIEEIRLVKEQRDAALALAEEELAGVKRERDLLIGKLSDVANGIDTRPGRVVAREMLARLSAC